MRPERLFHLPMVSAIALVWAVLALLGCGSDEPVQTVVTRTESFTFLDMGVNTALTEALREPLANRLGSVAEERRGLLDLTLSDDGFMDRHLPVLAGLNLDLNPASGERREHDIVRLTYRYPVKQTPAFNLVQLVFYGSTRRPLVFRIHANQAGSEILAALTEKYGPPETIEAKNDPDTHYRLWRRSGDVLSAVSSLDRFGDPEYLIAFYFTENLKDLVRAEKEAAAQVEQARRKAGKSAF
ncbi:MAG: hypothetical protein JEZ11_06030 [Desulfobacterales bacterium]|nr:hypothetical protein [Desulfobacterales bacterium]